jgi:hypothetical protein
MSDYTNLSLEELLDFSARQLAEQRHAAEVAEAQRHAQLAAQAEEAWDELVRQVSNLLPACLSAYITTRFNPENPILPMRREYVQLEIPDCAPIGVTVFNSNVREEQSPWPIWELTQSKETFGVGRVIGGRPAEDNEYCDLYYPAYSGPWAQSSYRFASLPEALAVAQEEGRKFQEWTAKTDAGMAEIKMRRILGSIEVKLTQPPAPAPTLESLIRDIVREEIRNYNNE